MLHTCLCSPKPAARLPCCPCNTGAPTWHTKTAARSPSGDCAHYSAPAGTLRPAGGRSATRSSVSRFGAARRPAKAPWRTSLRSTRRPCEGRARVHSSSPGEWIGRWRVDPGNRRCVLLLSLSAALHITACTMSNITIADTSDSETSMHSKQF